MNGTSPCLGWRDVSPCGVTVEFWISHYITVFSWRSPVGAPAPPSSGQPSQLRQRSLRERSVPTPGVNFTVAPLGFKGG